MTAEPDHTTFDALIAENQRLRRLAELVHDFFSPVDCEQFPKHGEEICNVFIMDRAEQDAYWYGEARKALGLPPLVSGSLRYGLVAKRNSSFHIGSRPSGLQ